MSVQGYIGEPANAKRYAVASNVTGANRVVSVSAARTITAAESGTVYSLVQSASAAFDITLPAAAAGLHYTFIVGTASDFAINIKTPGAANVIYGTIATPTTTDVAAVAAGDTIVITDAAAIGDKVELKCADGTVWSMTAFSGIDAGITGS
jgi:hypothetical protein